MNAVTKIVAADQPSRAERAHRAAIGIHRPNEPEDAMAYRVALALLRDQAGAGLAVCCDEAAPLLQMVSTQAAIAVYAPWSARKLFAIRAALELVMMAARSVEWAARV